MLNRRNSEFSPHMARWFGLSLAVALSVASIIVYWRFQSQLVLAIGGSATVSLLVTYYLIPSCQQPIYRVFKASTYPIQYIVTVILLAIVYFFVVAPIGLFLRLRGHDPLDRKGDDRASYWLERRKTPDDQSYLKTY